MRRSEPRELRIIVVTSVIRHFDSGAVSWISRGIVRARQAFVEPICIKISHWHIDLSAAMLEDALLPGQQWWALPVRSVRVFVRLYAP